MAADAIFNVAGAVQDISTTGDHTISGDLGGATAKGGLLFSGGGTLDDEGQRWGWRCSICLADDDDNVVSWNGGANNSSTSQVGRQLANDRIWQFSNGGGASTFADGEIPSGGIFTADDVVFDVTDGSGSYSFAAFQLAGDDVDVEVVTAQLSTEDTEVNVTGFSHEHDLYLVLCSNQTTIAGGADAAHMFGSMGVVLNDVDVTQYCIAFNAENGLSTGECRNYVSNARCGATITLSGSGLDYSILASDIDADGLTLAAKGGDAVNIWVGIAGITITNGQISASLQQVPSGTGADSVDDAFTFEPQAVLNILSRATSLNTVIDGEVGFGISAHDGTNGSTILNTIRDNASSNAYGAHNDNTNNFFYYNYHDTKTTTAAVATLTNFQKGGWVANWTDADDQAYFISIGMTAESPAQGGGGNSGLLSLLLTLMAEDNLDLPYLYEQIV